MHNPRSVRRVPASPIPGSGIPPRGLFLSRWSVLLNKPGLEAIGDLSCEDFNRDCITLLARAAQRHWKLYVCGNEPAIAQGRLPEERWTRFETRLVELLAAQGVVLTRHYACLDSTDGSGKRRRESVFEFPNTGVFYHAMQEDGLVLGESWILSADTHELAAGWRAGVHTACIGGSARRQAGDLAVEPDLLASQPAALLKEVLLRDPMLR